MIPRIERLPLALGALAGVCCIAAAASPNAPWASALAVVAFASAAFAAAQRIVLVPHASLNAGRIPIDWYDALAVSAALTIVAPWMVHAGVPAFRQDWYLSPLGSEFAHDLRLALSAWQPAELGYPTPQAGFHPLLLGWSAIAWALGSHAAVIVFLVAAIGAAGIFARRAIVALGCSDVRAAAVGGLAYELLAPTLNKLVAGHTLHLAGMAILPLVMVLCVRAVRASGRARIGYVLAAALAIALTAPQPQSFVLCIVGAAFVALASPSALPLAAVVIAAVLQAPTALAASLAAGDTYVVKRAVIEWQYAQSAPPALLASLGGYIARYFESVASAPSRIAAAAAVGAAMVGLTVGSRAAAAFGLLAWSAAFLIMGLYGPLAEALAFLYRNVDAFSLFREIYDLAPLLMLGVGLGFALAIAAAARAARFALPLAAAVLAAAALPTLSAPAQLVPLGGSAAAVRSIAALPGEGRILWLPGLYPISTVNGAGEGYDPLARRAGAHAAVIAMQPLPIVALAYTMLGADPQLAARVLERLGCSYVAIDRTALSRSQVPGALSAARLLAGARAFALVPSADPDVEIHALARPAPLVFAAGVSARSGGLDPQDPKDGYAVLLVDDPANAAALRELSIANLAWLRFLPSRDRADPNHALVAGRDPWQSFPTYAFAPAGDAVVGDNVSVHAIEGGVIAGAWEGRPVVDGRAVNAHSDLGEGSASTIVFNRAALVGTRSGPEVFSRAVTATGTGRVEFSRVSPTRIDGVVRGGAIGALVVRDRFDAGWHLDGPRHAVHFSADGWANGWVSEMHDGEHFRVEYRPQRAIAFAEWVVAFAWIGMLAGIGWARVRT